MKEEIMAHLDDHKELEKMYRANKPLFKREFGLLYPAIRGTALADFWYERLNHESEEISWGTGKGLLFVIIASVVAGLIAKLPAILGIDEEFFYSRNIGFIIFPALSAYFAWKNKLSVPKIALVTSSLLVALIFINALPDVKRSDTLTLSGIHLVLFLWSVLGFAFIADNPGDKDKRLHFLKYNGELVVMTTLILIAAGIMSGVTVGLFQLIGFNIERFYFQNVVVFGLPAVPIVANYLVQANPQLVGKVSPVIAKIFSPLVLVMLVTYLIAMIYSGKDPYKDREFLMIFNILLVGVMAIIFFSIAETARTTKSRVEIWILFLLSIVTIIVNSVALSAILFRISEWGITPNRAAVLGGNVLILINLILVTVQLFRVISKKAEISGIGSVIAAYLPVYSLWTAIVTFLFPLIFSFK